MGKPETYLLCFLDIAHPQLFYKLENASFRELDLFPPSGERRATSTLLGPLERANCNHWTTHLILTTAIKTSDIRLSQKETRRKL
jgi:hypothetical protein